jgi:hypothetical protein
MSSRVDQFNNHITAIVNLLASGQREEARILFNRNVIPEFEAQVQPEQRLYALFEFFYELDEYFNVPGRGPGSMMEITTEQVLEDYRSFYEEQLQEAREYETRS